MTRRNSNGEILPPAPFDDRSFDERQIESFSAAIARAFRAGWATGFQECAEGAVLEHGETDRPALETAALERWLSVENALKATKPTTEFGKGDQYVDLGKITTDPLGYREPGDY